MKPWSRSILVHAGFALAAASGSACDLPNRSTLQVQVEPRRAGRTLPIRVGMLPPIDSRPDVERDKTFFPRISVLWMSPFGTRIERVDTSVRDDSELVLPSDPDHTFGSRTVADLLGSHVARVVRDSGAFRQLVIVRASNWSVDELPGIARDAGLRYLFAMEIRHFYALRHQREALSQSHDPDFRTGQVQSQTHFIPPEETYAFESTVIRFRLFEVADHGVRVFWQMSARSNHGTNKPLGVISGSETAADCLRQLAVGLDELTRRYSSDALAGY